MKVKNLLFFFIFQQNKEKREQFRYSSFNITHYRHCPFACELYFGYVGLNGEDFAGSFLPGWSTLQSQKNCPGKSSEQG